MPYFILDCLLLAASFFAIYILIPGTCRSQRHQVNVQQVWFDKIVRREKKLEGRLNKGKFATVNEGDIFEVTDPTGMYVVRKVIAVARYASFVEACNELQQWNLLQFLLPGVASVREACAVYEQFYSPADQLQYGVVIFELN